MLSVTCARAGVALPWLWDRLETVRYQSKAASHSVQQARIGLVCPPKVAVMLPCKQIAAALKERAGRIYDKYGNVMLETEGMTKSGIERKATTRCGWLMHARRVGCCNYGGGVYLRRSRRGQKFVTKSQVRHVSYSVGPH